MTTNLRKISLLIVNKLARSEKKSHQLLIDEPTPNPIPASNGKLTDKGKVYLFKKVLKDNRTHNIIT